MREIDASAGRGRRETGGAIRREWLRPALLGLLASLALWAPSLAWAVQFKQAPGGADEAEADGDMILGLVHANTLFFIALGVFCVFWFLLGGGRKAKIGRKGH